MSTTQPIRDLQTLHDLKNFYLDTEPNLRNYALIVVGLNTALRINDLLHLKWENVFQEGRIREHIYVIERKTGKENRIFLNKEAKIALTMYRKSAKDLQNPYIFSSVRNRKEPMSRCQAYRVVRKAAQNTGLTEHISCHSLRKTFGYHAWKQGTPPALLMSIYNHSSYRITRRYLCIEQDDKDKVFKDIKL